MDGSASSRSRGVLLAWTLLLVLAGTLTALTVGPMLDESAERSRTTKLLLLRAIHLQTAAAGTGAGVRIDDVVATCHELARGEQASGAELRAHLRELVDEGLVSRRADQSCQLTPLGSALLEGVED